MTKSDDRLRTLLAQMDIPASRVQDWQWLLRNLAIRNGNHPNFEEAYALIKEQVKASYP